MLSELPKLQTLTLFELHLPMETMINVGSLKFGDKGTTFIVGNLPNLEELHISTKTNNSDNNNLAERSAQ